jgi:hypothetical protein
LVLAGFAEIDPVPADAPLQPLHVGLLYLSNEIKSIVEKGAGFGCRHRQ